MVDLVGMNHKMIVGDDAARARSCADDIEQTLQRFDCVLIPRVTIWNGNVKGEYLVQALPRAPLAEGGGKRP